MILETIIAVLKIVGMIMAIWMIYHFTMFFKESWKDLNEADKQRDEIRQSLKRLEDDIEALGDAWEEFYDKQYVPLVEAIEEIGIEVDY